MEKTTVVQFCQSCGIPMVTAEAFGTDSNGNPNQEYCVHCSKDGKFTVDCTMDEMIAISLKHMKELFKDKPDFSEQEALAKLHSFFPKLKRWKRNGAGETSTTKICQSCSMPMAATEHFGTNGNGSQSADYCCFCFQDGDFTHNLSMEETIENSVSHMDGSEKIDGRTLTRNEAALRMHNQLPTLKRWRVHELTHQEYFKAMNRAVDFINEHLNEPINLHDVASVANISRFHFHRLFRAFLGESPADYIQRLRLEKAIFKLQTSKFTLTEIAGQVGYQSPHALSKAIKKRFGVSTSVFRKQFFDVAFPVDALPQIEVKPEIKEISSKDVVYIQVANSSEKKTATTEAWKKLIQFVGLNGIPDEQHEYLCLSKDAPHITNSIHYRLYTCVTAPSGMKPKGKFGKQTIEGGLYAIFRHKGSYNELGALYCYIYRRWLPNGDYELRDISFFEKYINNPDYVAETELVTDIYIPIVPKQR